MTFDEYDKAAARTAGPAQTQQEGLALCALGICGEGGEFADEVKKHLFHTHPLHWDKLVEELGDVLWYVSRACSALGTTLEMVALGNVAKLKQRYPEGFSSDQSINRPCTVCGCVGWHSFSCTNN